LGVELAFQAVQSRAVVASDELVINMDREHEEVVALLVRVEARVCLGWRENLGLEPFVESLVETARGLLQTVEGFAEVKDLVGRDVAALWRRQVDCLFTITIEEGRFDVNLVTFEVEMVDQRVEDSDGVLVRDSCVEIIEVDSFPLRVPFSDPSSLVAGRLSSVAVNLACADPGCSNHSHVGLAIHDFPDSVLVHLGKFRIHCRFPMFPFARCFSLVVRRWCRGCESVCEIAEWVLGVCECKRVIRVVFRVAF
jgi:hypothetical protein